MSSKRLALSPGNKSKRVKITRAMWDTTPRDNKRKHKDGTTLMRCVVPGTKSSTWVTVYWEH